MEIILNQKSYFNSFDDIKKYQNDLKNYKDKIVVMPSFIYLSSFIENGFTVGCQNVSDEDVGAYTGEVSASSLKDLGVSYVLIGHSEIRRKYKDEDLRIKSKINFCLKNGLKVILCIGEYEKNTLNYDLIDSQLEGIKKNVIISYEPVWAIGSGVTPSISDISSTIKYIKLKGYSHVLYGGSVNDRTIKDLSLIKDIDGFLVGSCSVNFADVIKMIEVLSK